MPKSHFIYLPSVEGSLEEELKSCLDKIKNTCSEGYIPVKLNIFSDIPDFESSREVVKNTGIILSYVFPSECPAFCITAMPPEKPWKVAIEATLIQDGLYNIHFRRHKGFPYLVLESSNGKELWAAGLSSYTFPGDTRKAAEAAFDLANEILTAEDMTMDNIVRQWNYIGNILTIRDNIQNYQVFNEVRNDYYTRYRKGNGYPAATGVGMMHGGVILDFCALQPGESTILKPVDNPHQLNAYNYGPQVLKGDAPTKGSLKHPPQFERALLITNSEEVTLHISGTASIIGQETVGRDDVEKQTMVTIENIESLADVKRINLLLPGSFLSRRCFSLLRVYVKKDQDFNNVKRICTKLFPLVPSVFVKADICRDDLLMEVEAEAVLAS